MPKREYIASDLADKMFVSEPESAYIEQPNRRLSRFDDGHLNVQTRDLAVLAMLSLTAISGRDEGESMEEKFIRLADTWEDETKLMSSMNDIVTNQTHLQIVAMGPDVVPLILQRICHHPGWWFEALRFLTGQDPVPENARGKLLEMTAAWLKWGEENGYS